MTNAQLHKTEYELWATVIAQNEALTVAINNALSIATELRVGRLTTDKGNAEHMQRLIGKLDKARAMAEKAYSKAINAYNPNMQTTERKAVG